MKEKNIEQENDVLKVTDEVFSVIAGIALTDVTEVVLQGGVMSSVLGKKNITKGIKITQGQGNVRIDIPLIVKYGAEIHIAAQRVQYRVRDDIERLTGIKVSAVNISVVGIITNEN